MWEGGRYIINEPNCCSTCRREDVTLRKQSLRLMFGGGMVNLMASPAVAGPASVTIFLLPYLQSLLVGSIPIVFK